MKIYSLNAEGFCGYHNTVFGATGCFYHHCCCQEARPALTEEAVQRGTKKREKDEM